MLLALLSDSHDNERSTRAALELLKPYKPAAYLHAGDLVSPDMLNLFAGLPFHFVFGNNEYDHAAIRSQALAAGVHCHDMCADLTFAGKRIALLHGHEYRDMDRVLSCGHYDYIIHGHTHVQRDERFVPATRPAHIGIAAVPARLPGSTRIINPGALHRARVKSVCLLDVGIDELRVLEVRA